MNAIRPMRFVAVPRFLTCSGAVLGVLLVLAGCAGTPATDQPAQTWLAVLGPRDWIPPEPMSLEIGDLVWSVTPDGGNGVVTPNLASRQEVRLVGFESCREYAAFAIEPGSAWIIGFDDDGSVRVEDAAGQAHAMGPGLVEGTRADCATSPSSS